MQKKLSSRKKIQMRIRNKISGTPQKPRLNVYRSNKAIYCQLIDDVAGVTIASASSNEVDKTGTKIEVSRRVGNLIGNKIKDLGIASIVFDRGGYLYHGRVKSLAEGARESGVNF